MNGTKNLCPHTEIASSFLASRGEVAGRESLVEQRRKAQQEETIRALCKTYFEWRASRKKSAKDDRRRIEQHTVPTWGNCKADGVTRTDVVPLRKL